MKYLLVQRTEGGISRPISNLAPPRQSVYGLSFLKRRHPPSNIFPPCGAMFDVRIRLKQFSGHGQTKLF